MKRCLSAAPPGPAGAAELLRPLTRRRRGSHSRQREQPPARAAILCGDTDKQLTRKWRPLEQPPSWAAAVPAHSRPQTRASPATLAFLTFPKALSASPGPGGYQGQGKRQEKGGEGKGAGDRGWGGEGGSARDRASLRVTTAAAAPARCFPPPPP